jgi:DNA-binding NtrC family response regulator
MLFTPTERAFADTVRELAYANPFDNAAQQAIRSRLELFDLNLAAEERRQRQVVAPGVPFVEVYVPRLEALLTKLSDLARKQKALPSRVELERYEDLVIAVLHMRHFAIGNLFTEAIKPGERVSQFAEFSTDLERWSRVPFALTMFLQRPEHAFAVYFQYQSAYRLLHELIRGQSRPAMRLKAATWYSIFPRELRLYGSILYERMHDVTTLILGPSGTGKELVATAIGLSRYIPFDRKRERFAEPFTGAFHPLNLSAMPRDLIESEMFGHTAGAFTGATKDREGWFEKCRRGHTVFLDELGELPESVQVRLLRVLQNREFYRVGETEPRTFSGRVIAATNRNLSELISAGRFREDLYFRLCSDVIHTPTLREQLDDSPEELPMLVRHVAGRVLGEKAEEEFVQQLTEDALRWIESSPAMGARYSWPGNFRELEQCVRSVMVRGEYHAAAPVSRTHLNPTSGQQTPTSLDEFLREVRAGSLTFEELLVRYCSFIQSKTGNIAETSRRLKKHRVTIQQRIDPEWIKRFQG